MAGKSNFEEKLKRTPASDFVHSPDLISNGFEAMQLDWLPLFGSSMGVTNIARSQMNKAIKAKIRASKSWNAFVEEFCCMTSHSARYCWISLTAFMIVAAIVVQSNLLEDPTQISTAQIFVMITAIVIANLTGVLARTADAIETENCRKCQTNPAEIERKQEWFADAVEAFFDRAEQRVKAITAPLLPEELPELAATSPDIVQISNKDLAFLKLLQDAMAEKISDPGFRVEELAAALHISRQTLENRLRELLSCTPAKFMTECRICEAKRLLLLPAPPINGASRIASIAKLVGYRDVATFRQRFKEVTGVTPSRFKG